jgi:hypothetical protein
MHRTVATGALFTAGIIVGLASCSPPGEKVTPGDQR